MCQIGFSLQASYSMPLEQVIRLLKEAGFSAVSPLWSPELDLVAIDAQTRALGMTIQSLHAPHGGLAFGLDRIVMLMAGSESIRDTIAFPKVKDSGELMIQSPDVVDKKQLDELGLAIVNGVDRSHSAE